MLRYIVPPALLVAAFFAGKHLLDTAPEAKRQPVVDRSPIVELQTLEPQDYAVTVKASGIVRTHTQTNLVAEAAGRITQLSANFQAGGYVKKGESLLSLDTSSYNNAIDISKSEASSNQYALQQLDTEEQTLQRSLQLAQNNLRLGQQALARTQSLWDRRLIARNALDAEQQQVNQLRQQVEDLQGKLSAFPSRRSVVHANMASAQARLEREQLNLSRTQVYAPYTGRILEKRIDIGQYVSPGTVLGIMYATDYAEVDLPLSLAQFDLLDLPNGGDKALAKKGTVVSFSQVGSEDQWQGRIVRTAAALDNNSRQINVIARIDKPFEVQAGNANPLRIGQFLNAQMVGKTFKDVYVLPPTAVRQGREILLVKEGQVQFQPVNPVWSNDKEIVVEAPIPLQGKQVIVTPLAQATPGLRVKTPEQQKAEAAKRREQGAKPQQPATQVGQ